MLIHDFLTAANSDQWDKICLIHGERQLTYGELRNRTDHLARRLAGGIAQGEAVLVQLADPVEQLLYFFAIIKAGGACVLIDSSAGADVAAAVRERHQLPHFIDEAFSLPANDSALPEIHQEDIFLGAFSSGSTGSPKLIWRDHQSWCSAFLSQNKIFGLSGRDTLYITGSLVYTGNLNICLQMLAAGGTVTIAAGRMPRRWVHELISCQATAIYMVPANYRLLLQAMDRPLSHITAVSSAGAKLDPHTASQMLLLFPKARIIEYYGASELGHITYQTAAELIEHPGSVGKAFPGVTITVEDGIIWVESPYLAPQYRPKASIGDLGQLDDQGYLSLHGRMQGIINSGGVKVVPEQVEAVLLQCPGIAEAAVGGIDDPIRGQLVCAWLVKNRPELKNRDVLAFCRERMFPHCCPRKIIFIEAMPLTASGKVDRKRLQEYTAG